LARLKLELGYNQCEERTAVLPDDVWNFGECSVGIIESEHLMLKKVVFKSQNEGVGRWVRRRTEQDAGFRLDSKDLENRFDHRSVKMLEI